MRQALLRKSNFKPMQELWVTGGSTRFRFAPSPNGYLHLGHAYSALYTKALAQSCDGTFLLRIEDIDLQRSKAEFMEAIFDDLSWLGLIWPLPVVQQSQRFDAYQQAAQHLKDLGVLYPCVASRAEISAAAKRFELGSDPDGAPLYAGRDRVVLKNDFEQRIAIGAAVAWRIDMQHAMSLCQERLAGEALSYRVLGDEGEITRHRAYPERWGDAVILRKDTPASYHLAVVVDDAFQGVTHVTRGLDLLPSTDIQRVLQVLLDLPEPIYFHHPLILDDTGQKLSKSMGSTAIKALRAEGATQNDIIGLINRNRNINITI